MFLNDFVLFIKKYPIYCEKYLRDFSKIDIQAAIDIVEKNNEVVIPWEVKFWIEKTISTRLEDMMLLFEQYKNEKRK